MAARGSSCTERSTISRRADRNRKWKNCTSSKVRGHFCALVPHVSFFDANKKSSLLLKLLLTNYTCAPSDMKELFWKNRNSALSSKNIKRWWKTHDYITAIHNVMSLLFDVILHVGGRYVAGRVVSEVFEQICPSEKIRDLVRSHCVGLYLDVSISPITMSVLKFISSNRFFSWQTVNQLGRLNAMVRTIKRTNFLPT